VCKAENFGILDVFCKCVLVPGDSMSQSFILEYWNDDDWLVGRLKGIPGVFSQGQTLEELEENIRDAYQLMNMEAEPTPAEVKTKELVLEI
jgi:predicted RNase H-like HicB family nuclease